MFERKSLLEKKMRERPEPINDLDTDRESVLRDSMRWAAIEAEEKESLFIKGGTLIEIIGDDQIPVNSKPKMQSWLHSNGVKYTSVKHSKNGTEIMPGRLAPLDICDVMVSRVEPWVGILDTVSSVTTVPFFRPDGSIVTRRGYYKDLKVFNTRDIGLILDDKFDVTHVTKKHAQDALMWLRTEIFGDFPYHSEVDRANAMAAPLALLTRYIHGDVLPLWGITAKESGTGKGYHSEVLSAIITSHDYGTTGLPGNETELTKTVGSILSGAQPVVRWDNVDRGSQITSATLCRLHTSAVMQTRTLGQSKIPSGINDRLWIADGNNIRPGEDMVRRYVQVALDAGSKDPSMQGKSYRHDDLIHFIHENRSSVIGRYLIMYKAWADAGGPLPKNAPKNSTYKSMIEVVAGVLEYAGETNFWGNMVEVRDEAISGSDEEVNLDFLRWIRTNPGLDANRFNSAQVVQAIKDAEPGAFSVSDMSVPVPEMVAMKWNLGPAARSKAMTKFFKGIEDQRFGSEEILRVAKIDYKSGNKTHFAIKMEVVGDRPDIDWEC